jgi:hypothetical protein
LLSVFDNGVDGDPQEEQDGDLVEKATPASDVMLLGQVAQQPDPK